MNVKVKHEPLRKCIITKQMLPKKHMLRIVRTSKGEVLLDLTGKISGKGVYFVPSKENLEIIKTRRVINKVLRREIPNEIYAELEKYCK